VRPSVTQLELSNRWIYYKLRQTCFGLSLAIIRFHLNSYAVRVLYNFCKRALVLRSHHLRVRLDIASGEYHDFTLVQ